MASNTSIQLTDHWREFAQRKVAEGRYASTSEVVRDGLRLLEAQEQRRDALRAAIRDGIESGPSEPFDIDAFIDRKIAGRAAD